MSDYGITPEGFKAKRFPQLLEELNAEMREIFGDDMNLTPESPDGQVSGALSEDRANLWELSELSYNARNPSAAVGAALSSLVQLNYIQRLPGTPTRAELTLGGTEGAFIPAGSLARSPGTDTTFSTSIDATLDVGGTAIVVASATEVVDGVRIELDGPVIAVAGSISAIDTPVTGWSTVTNIEDAIPGTFEETDTELRARRESSTAAGAVGSLDALAAAVANIPGVTNRTVIENRTSVVDANGLPPHSFEVIVSGGEDQIIADVIWSKMGWGEPIGTTSLPITDSQGISHTMRFTRPLEIAIYVKVTVTTGTGYPADGDDQIKQAIVDYSQGDLVQGRGFGVGQDVIYTRLYTPINSVPGHEIDELLVDIVSPPTGTANIPIAIEEVSHFVVANIEVVSS
jgi:uncharacterized phage protein gp47/JayE